MKTVGIVAHSVEGAALCFQTACLHAETRLGPFMHPTVVMSAIPMGLSMAGWRENRHAEVGVNLSRGIQIVADAGADFFVCPDNTAHIVLEPLANTFAVPGLHIAEVVCREIRRQGWKRVGLLGTVWTMTGPVYERVLSREGMERLVPDGPTQQRINAAIFDELCRGVRTRETTEMFRAAIDALKRRGAECVILGCTEIPLVITDANSSLPVLDSTRLLARCAVEEAMREGPLAVRHGWVVLEL